VKVIPLSEKLRTDPWGFGQQGWSASHVPTVGGILAPAKMQNLVTLYHTMWMPKVWGAGAIGLRGMVDPVSLCVTMRYDLVALGQTVYAHI